MADQILLVSGVVILACGMGAYANPIYFRKTLGGFVTNPALIYFVGILNVAIGMFIVLNNNIWNSFPEVVVTFVGWAGVVRGFIMLIAPQFFLRLFKTIWMGKGHLIGEAVMMMLLGAVLIYLAIF